MLILHFFGAPGNSLAPFYFFAVSVSIVCIEHCALRFLEQIR
jgi:hypothetical protein